MIWKEAKGDAATLNKDYLVFLSDGTHAILKFTGNYTWEPLIPYDPFFIEYNTLARVTHFMELPPNP